MFGSDNMIISFTFGQNLKWTCKKPLFVRQNPSKLDASISTTALCSTLYHWNNPPKEQLEVVVVVLFLLFVFDESD